MRKEFEMPVAEVTLFETEDIITASTPDNNGGPEETVPEE